MEYQIRLRQDYMIIYMGLMDRLPLIACILADAFGVGTEKMSQMSNIGYNHLRTFDENFMYVENLKLANDGYRIVAIAKKRKF